MSRETAADYREQFLGVLSHELRTPLNAIAGFGSILVDGLAGGLSDPQRTYAEKILAASERMLGLVDDLLDLSRMQAGRFAIAPVPMAIAPTVAQVLDEQAQAAAAQRISLAADMPGDLPTVNGDATRVRQIVTNLVSNAIKYSPNGGDVRVRVQAAASSVRIEVRDTGLGIPLEAQSRVFDAFMQVDMSNTRAFGGVGLGLAIVKTLVEAHGGELGLISEPGQGSTFWFTLPLAAEPGTLPVQGAHERPNQVT
ncbi:Signal transduction histidine-protein kinase BarA [compost metagenome]